MATSERFGTTTSHQLNKPWEEDGKMVVGIDIGTTQSGVAYVCLEKGQKPVIHRITKWPGQEANNQRAKVPTVIYYNLETKKAESFGAEALSREGQEDAAEKGWFLVKHFKLRLQPRELREEGMIMDALPPGISIEQIYSDFLGYLLKHVQAFVEKRTAQGKRDWEKYKPKMEVVLAHPNGWGISEQDFLRKAAVKAGFVDSSSASNQIRFVTEAEASIHYCLHHSNLSEKLQDGTTLAVCDAGGSTVDTTLYSVISTSGPVVRLDEARTSSSIQAGGIRVNTEFEKFTRKALKDFGLSEAQVSNFTATALQDFENNAKRQFGNPDSDRPEYSIVVTTGDFTYGANPPKIRRGAMKVPSQAIKQCFDTCVNPILSDVDQQLNNHSVQYILLVGGFGDSNYLSSRFESHYESSDCEVVLADDHTSKAVADGSVIWNILCSVCSRVPRRSIGMICARAVLPWAPEAQGRDMYMSPHGLPVIPGRWCPIVKKGVPVDAEEIYRDSVSHISTTSNPTSISVKTDLYSYSGDDEPTWARDKKEELLPGFQKLCTISAHLYDLEGALKKETGLFGNSYWELEMNVCIQLGTTELRAHLEWEQNGITREGPATVVPGKPVDF